MLSEPEQSTLNLESNWDQLKKKKKVNQNIYKYANFEKHTHTRIFICIHNTKYFWIPNIFEFQIFRIQKFNFAN